MLRHNIQMLARLASAEECNVSINRSLRRLVKAMKVEGLAYREAVRRFETAYIEHVRTLQSGHLGKTAAMLGVHHNTLTRKFRLLGLTGPLEEAPSDPAQRSSREFHMPPASQC